MAIENTVNKPVGLVLLAAGTSSRLGHPKQLLAIGNDSLLKHSLRIAASSAAHPVVVVLGAYAETIKTETAGTDITQVVNENWQEGMASSIRCGLETLVRIDPNTGGTIIMVCDQPYVTTGLLNELMLVHQQNKKPIVACSYENTFGPPVLFDQSMFPELLKLTGDVGARALVQEHLDKVETIPFPKGNIDVDTETDYENLKVTLRDI